MAIANSIWDTNPPAVVQSVVVRGLHVESAHFGLLFLMIASNFRDEEIAIDWGQGRPLSDIKKARFEDGLRFERGSTVSILAFGSKAHEACLRLASLLGGKFSYKLRIATRRAKILDKYGFHCLPSVSLVKLAWTFHAAAFIECSGAIARADSIMGVEMVLRGKQEATATIMTIGPDARRASSRLASHVGSPRLQRYYERYVAKIPRDRVVTKIYEYDLSKEPN